MCVYLCLSVVDSSSNMTRRRFYAPPIAFSHDGQSATLSADETRHLRDVLRLRVGDEAYVFDGEGREFRGSVSNTDRSSSVIRIIEQAQPLSAESLLNLTLAVALLKGEKFDVVVQKATELGASCVVPLITSRADVRIHNPEDAQKKQARWQRIALEATKQCGRAKLIKIEAPVSLATCCIALGSVMLSRNSACIRSCRTCWARRVSSAADGSLLFVQPFIDSSVSP